jgi:hypothetical protein
MKPARRVSTAVFLVIALGALGLVACRDREQQARIDGASVRAEVARSCASAEGPEVHAECAEGHCRERCSAYAGAKAFEHACIDACGAAGACETDADCGEGLRCIAIAPVVRRCRAPR